MKCLYTVGTCRVFESMFVLLVQQAQLYHFTAIKCQNNSFYMRRSMSSKVQNRLHEYQWLQFPTSITDAQANPLSLFCKELPLHPTVTEYHGSSNDVRVELSLASPSSSSSKGACVCITGLGRCWISPISISASGKAAGEPTRGEPPPGVDML